MSQQTRLEVVVPRFQEWMRLFPSPPDLAGATEERVLSAWAGLGYYSRARNLRRAAAIVARDGWPRTAVDLAKLPGVGPYTAAAIASLCHGEKVAMVDGNVIRVLSRLYALDADPRTGSGAKRMAEFASAWVSQGEAGAMNEATMELGSLVCTPRNPDCASCPLSEICLAASRDEAERYPPPRSRPEKVLVRRTAVVVQGELGVLLRRAGSAELLSGLWILPCEGDHADLTVSASFLGEVRHAITNHDVRWTVVEGAWSGRGLPVGWLWCPVRELSERIVSSLPRKALALAGIRIQAPGAGRRGGERPSSGLEAEP
jgi:A/G-specific adenine glycosylase